VVAFDQFEKQVAFRRLARLTGAEDESQFGGNLASFYSLLNGRQQFTGGFIPAGGKPADSVND
jgi:hypothetical protein